MRHSRRPRRAHQAPGRDRGAVDVSIQMLFGSLAVIMAMLLVFEVAAFWHARNVFDDAAAEGARVAAAYDGTCRQGVTAARTMVRQAAGSWGEGARITCVDGPVITVNIAGRTPGMLGGALVARASESAPKEG